MVKTKLPKHLAKLVDTPAKKARAEKILRGARQKAILKVSKSFRKKIRKASK